MNQRTDTDLAAPLLDLTRRNTTGEVTARRHVASRARVLDRLYTPRRSPVFAWVAIAGAVTIGGGATFAATKQHFARLHGIGVASAVPSASVEVETADTTPDTVTGLEEPTATVEITVSPDSAKIYWDDNLLVSNPGRVMDPPDKKQHRLRAEAPGYMSKTQLVFVGGANTTISLELKATPLEIGPISASAPLPDADSVIEGLRDEFRACYEEGLATDPKMGGKATITLKISEAGTVLASDITAKEGLSAKVTTCLSHVASKAEFSSMPKPETLSIPIAFTSK